MLTSALTTCVFIQWHAGFCSAGEAKFGLKFGYQKWYFLHFEDF